MERSRKMPTHRDASSEAGRQGVAVSRHKSDGRDKHKKESLDGGGRDPFVRAENEDDDGYDPYSDRTAGPEPLFERDPWD